MGPRAGRSRDRFGKELKMGRAQEQTGAVPAPQLFCAHPNLSDEVNRNIIRSEIEGGVELDRLAEGDVLHVETLSRLYTIVYRGEGRALIAGHPRFCPYPTPVRIEGSTWGGSMLKTRYVGRGMHLEFRHPYFRTIVTSRILDVRFAGNSNPAKKVS
jgi:hypothetical protein